MARAPLVAVLPLCIALVAPSLAAAAGAGASGAGTSVATPAPGAAPAGRQARKMRAGDLVGLPLMDVLDRPLGYVRAVTRGADGRIALVIPLDGRLVALPLEAVAIFGRSLTTDLPPGEFAGLRSWTGAGEKIVPPNDTIDIALTAR